MDNQKYVKTIIDFFKHHYTYNLVVQSYFLEVKNDYQYWGKKFESDLEKCKSPIEQIMFSILNQNECISVTPQYKIGPYTVDFLIRIMDKEFIIECDGYDFHEKTKEQSQHDKSRDRYLKIHGYDVYRFTGSEIYNNPIKIMIEIDEIVDKYCGEYQK